MSAVGKACSAPARTTASLRVASDAGSDARASARERRTHSETVSPRRRAARSISRYSFSSMLTFVSLDSVTQST